jgi:hypothetical protein
MEYYSAEKTISVQYINDSISMIQYRIQHSIGVICQSSDVNDIKVRGMSGLLYGTPPLKYISSAVHSAAAACLTVDQICGQSIRIEHDLCYFSMPWIERNDGEMA